MAVSARPLTGAALDDDALQAVRQAAEHRRFVVVPHRAPADAVGDDALAELSANLPASWVRGVDGEVEAVGSRPAELGPVLPQDRDTPTVTRIYHLQRTPSIRQLIDAVYDPLERDWPAAEPWIERDAGLFVTSSGAVTPAHGDRHHNLLLQLTGAKEIGVCLPGSPGHARAVARSLPGLYIDEMPVGSEVVALPAGAALYLPPYSIHWVRSTDAAVALSCGWSTAATIRAGQVYAARATLLRLRLPTPPVGGRTDGVALRAAAGLRRIRAARRR